MKMQRELGALAATALVVGTIVGTGVFIKSAVMSQRLGDARLVLFAWFVAGLVSLAGALTYAELASCLPKAGGEYVYLRSAYGDLSGFLFGWTRFWIGAPGSIAAYSVGAATFLNGALTGFGTREAQGLAADAVASAINAKLTALLFILVFTALNTLQVKKSGRFNTAVTAVKLFLIVSLPLGIFLLSRDGSWSFFEQQAVDTLAITNETTSSLHNLSAFGMAMLAAFWAYDGWNNLVMAAGEVKNPERNLPLALVTGLVVVIALYLLMNLSFFYVLPVADVAASFSTLNPGAHPVATVAASSFLSASSLPIMSLVFFISAIGAMNGSILTNARVPYALAADGLFPKFLGRLGKSSGVPVVALWLQAAIAAVLVALGSFDQLTDYVLFASWIFYGLCAFAIFRLRRQGYSSTYRVWGYPWIPITFVIVSVALVFNTLVTSFFSSAIGLGLIGAGIPVYFLFKKPRRPGPPTEPVRITNNTDSLVYIR